VLRSLLDANGHTDNISNRDADEDGALSSSTNAGSGAADASASAPPVLHGVPQGWLTQQLMSLPDGLGELTDSDDDVDSS
jgi:hypothetical protein